MDTHDDDAFHANLKQLINGPGFFFYISVRAAEHHAEALVFAFHFQASQQAAAETRPEAVHNHANQTIGIFLFFLRRLNLFRQLRSGYKGTFSCHPDNPALLRQQLQRFFARYSADTVLLRQFFFRRQSVSFFVGSVFNTFNNIIVYLFIKRQLFHSAPSCALNDISFNSF